MTLDARIDATLVVIVRDASASAGVAAILLRLRSASKDLDGQVCVGETSALLASPSTRDWTSVARDDVFCAIGVAPSAVERAAMSTPAVALADSTRAKACVEIGTVPAKASRRSNGVGVVRVSSDEIFDVEEPMSLRDDDATKLTLSSVIETLAKSSEGDPRMSRAVYDAEGATSNCDETFVDPGCGSELVAGCATSPRSSKDGYA
ncbi:hypothetical protein [Methylosinus sp. LW4]|uniref:hypothetical protein n=1 Tax=Methylosinus sp. LW4 TaxID=136993 RepID=UPI0003A30C16|nr:hypothetical protein [Methylosinus sp. LW4]